MLEVAVKRLKEDPSEQNLEEFREEIKLMKVGDEVPKKTKHLFNGGSTHGFFQSLSNFQFNTQPPSPSRKLVTTSS